MALCFSYCEIGVYLSVLYYTASAQTSLACVMRANTTRLSESQGWQMSAPGKLLRGDFCRKEG
jgi:uncharacterized protein YaiE (UPF0345 family)